MFTRHQQLARQITAARQHPEGITLVLRLLRHEGFVVRAPHAQGTQVATFKPLLPSQAQIANDLGISRGPVREAFRMLEE